MIYIHGMLKNICVGTYKFKFEPYPSEIFMESTL